MSLDRRTLGAAVVATVAAVGAVWAGARPWRRRWHEAGLVPTSPGWHPRADGLLWLRVDERGYVAALERRCPHQGCLVHVRSDDLFCPCHGSRFDMRGARLEGPTPRGLAWFALRVRAGRVDVDLARPRRAPQWVRPA